MKTDLKILVCGGSGFIGSHVCKKLSDKNIKNYSIDNHTQYFFPLDEFAIRNISFRHNHLLTKTKILNASLNNSHELREVIHKIKPNIIINLAALPLAGLAVKRSETAYKSILSSTFNLLEVIKNAKFVDKYIHISSSMVYGNFTENPIKEISLTDPIEIYGSLKLSSEHLVKSYSKIYKINYNIIRPTAVYGPSDNNRRILFKMIKSAIDRKKNVTLFNPKNNYLDFTFVEDTAEGIVLSALSKIVNETFNISFGSSTSLYDAAEIVKKYFPNFEYNLQNDSTFYPIRGQLNISKAKKLLKFKPKYSLKKGLKIYCDYMQEFKK